MPQREMDHGGIDPAQALIDKIGYIDDVDIYFNKILCALYLRPEKTKSGLFLTDEHRDEDKYQGKAAVVLKVGPTAFMDDGQAQFHGQTVAPGDWVVFRPSNGLKMTINKTDCILLQDVQIEMRVPSPDMIF